MSLVSVVVGTYNGSKYIEAQLESILNQTYEISEIIVIDDNSDDNTVELVKSLSEKHQNIKIHAFDENLGYIKNFERGMALATGDLIALSDQDDWWHATKIEKLVANIGDSDVIYCDSIFTNEHLQPTGDGFSNGKNMLSTNNPLHFLIDNCVSGHAMLLKKSLFEKAIPFPVDVPHDWWLTFYASLNNGVLYFDEALVDYRHHDTNVIAETKTKKTKIEKLKERRSRMNAFYEATLKNNHPLTDTIFNFNKSYASNSLLNKTKRVFIFQKHKNDILAILKKSSFKKFIFCLNMFFKLK